jgi:hypothetical protein
MPNLYLVHCGFYDCDIAEGIFESHVNIFTVACSFEEARSNAKRHQIFRSKRMHVDGIQQIVAVQGWTVALQQSSPSNEDTLLISNTHRELAPRT